MILCIMNCKSKGWITINRHPGLVPGPTGRHAMPSGF